ncbi:sulfate adenylyltransferase [Chloroflexota bacterium]
MKLIYQLDEENLQDLINLSTGVFYPLEGFMASHDYRCVVDHMRLDNGSVWSIPLTLDISPDLYRDALHADRLFLMYDGQEAGFIEIDDCYRVNLQEDASKVYKTADINHPAVMKEMSRSEYRVGGKVTLTDKSLLVDSLTPEKTQQIFTDKKWKTVVGFHTRNPVHRAHEHLQRVGLEYCDGLFINPFLGWKKPGDFTDEAIMKAYTVMVETYYPQDKVYLEGIRISMRYAGPREAIFHALIRRNLGCTHFIVGRDHAGVGSYYGKYEAQELAQETMTKENLGIEILPLKEPYFCMKCNQVVSEKNCRHDAEYIIGISGTRIREMLREGKRPDERFMRPEVVDALLELNERKFIGS